MGLVETKEAIAAASRAFTTWGKTSAKERHDLLARFYQLMRENDDDLIRLIVRLNSCLTNYVTHIVLNRLSRTESRCQKAR